MTLLKRCLLLLCFSLALSASLIIETINQSHAVGFVNYLTIAGENTDRSPLNDNSGGANVNRLGGFGSDFYYDRYENVYYGVADRGPGGGTIGYDTRVQKFSLEVNPRTGKISKFKLLKTILFKKPDGTNFNGFSPDLDPENGNPSLQGRSLDPEGFVVSPKGNFYVSDEYGPSIYEFSPKGIFIRAFQTPDNLLPRDNQGNFNFATGPALTSDPIVSGRQGNRGFEGLTISPNGKKLFAILQDPLINEGQDNQGNSSGSYSRNLRLVEFDTATGRSPVQYIYQLESVEDINSRVPNAPFKLSSQGSNIGVSAVTAVNDHKLLVLERDNRGFGVGDTTGGNPPVSTKRIYKIDLRGATNVSNISLTNTNDLPSDVQPVSKSSSPLIDIAATLQANGQIVPEKIESLAIGPKLANGSYAVIVGTDNDFSVTQNNSGTQFDVCTGGTLLPIDSGCPEGESLISSYIYSFKVSPKEL
ncbi:MAG: esterase-like activity of phytase family protein [Stigonema ocellatum SAG 48.90 = DSM 106950]|nr:esterase-like activity of phytase family protein [Stigonema ocellatum SAG 48.90 = DSM 106950]